MLLQVQIVDLFLILFYAALTVLLLGFAHLHLLSFIALIYCLYCCWMSHFVIDCFNAAY